MKFVVALLACALVVAAAPPRAQEGPRTRPRRVAPPPAETQELKDEPLVRVGLLTGARSLEVTATGRLLAVRGPGGEPVPLEAARVRVEPRSFKAPRPASAGHANGPDESAQRGVAVYAAGGARPLFEARGAVAFAVADEAAHALGFRGKTYRGRLEVSTDARGALALVNVVGLEDYVRGVVPNELSPGRWGEPEALKAQAVAARTYALGSARRFEGFDLTPDQRSQVYGGRASEHPKTDRAVAETRGLVATYAGRPIDAVYTSTCGGRTEHAEHIFNRGAVPYLRARECAAEAGRAQDVLALRTTRTPPELRMAEHAASPRDAALLAVHGFPLPPRLDDDWLEDFIPADDMRALLARVAALSRRPPPRVGAEATRPAGFATALLLALDGESRGSALLNRADVAYQLAFRDAAEVPESHRADVAELLRTNLIGLFPDGTLRPRQAMTRARALGSIARALEARGALKLQRATTQPARGGALVVSPAGARGREQALKTTADVFLFRAFGEGFHQLRELTLVGGEPVAYHTDARGEVDYLEVRPAPQGAAADRFAPNAFWTETLAPDVVVKRLGRAAAGVGALVDLRVARRGESGRVIDLEVVGTEGTAHIRGGRVRSALELRDQLFVIGREFGEGGRVTRFTFDGRGWGHGVGLCQTGAYGLALSGYNFEQILKHYYTGIELARLY